MNFPDDETGQVLAEMQQAGIDLSVDHDVVFFSLFEKEDKAKEMADYITENLPHVKVSMQPDESPNVWDLDCSLTLLPSYENIIEQEAKFEKIAEKFPKGFEEGKPYLRLTPQPNL